MRLSNFKFKLPEELIAQFPSRFRDDARLFVLHAKTGEIEHKMMNDLASYFDEGDIVIANDTKVFPARLYAQKEKTLANIEVFLLRELQHENRYWDVLVDPARKIRIGNKLFFDEDATIVAEVIDNTTSRGRTLRFLTDYEGDDFVQHLYAMGVTPLPKYIHRPMDEDTQEKYEEVFGDLPVDEMDEERYQTVFAEKIGAVAAPAVPFPASSLQKQGMLHPESPHQPQRNPPRAPKPTTIDRHSSLWKSPPGLLSISYLEPKPRKDVPRFLSNAHPTVQS